MEVTFAGVRYRTIWRERRRADGGERTTTLATEVATLVERAARFAEPAARRRWRAWPGNAATIPAGPPSMGSGPFGVACVGRRTGDRVKIVVGLGNPGDPYAKTRHTIGWMVLDRLPDPAGCACQSRTPAGLESPIAALRRP